MSEPEVPGEPEVSDERDERDREPAPEADLERSEMSLETPPEDAAEQHAALAGEDEAEPRWPRRMPFDANEADAADQERQVDLDEDDYR
jgi:hypothetical protein